MTFKIHDIETGEVQSFSLDSIPAKYRWAYDHIVAQDCGSISMGTTVFEVTE